MVLQLTASEGTKQPGDPLVQQGIQKPGRLGPGQHGAAPGTLPQELRAPKQRNAGGNHRWEKIDFFSDSWIPSPLPSSQKQTKLTAAEHSQKLFLVRKKKVLLL